jgi:tetratricopeptide (TPR) repeat protein
VLALALLALGVLAVLVAGVVMFAARGRVSPLPMRGAASIAQQQLPDGSLLVLEQVTYGREHHIDLDARGRSPVGFAGAPSGQRGRTVQTSKDLVVVWLTKWDSQGRPLDFDWFLRCAATDAHGCEIDNVDRGRYARTRNGSSSEHGGTGPFSRLSGGPYETIVTHFGMPAFRSAGATFKLRVYDTDNRMVAQFNVPDPRPTGDTFPQWQPEPLPVTKTDGDLSLTLTTLTAQSSESTRTVNGVAIAEKRVRLNPRVVTKQAGQPTSQWSSHSYRLADALGNESSVWDCKLCPKESAWELEIKAWRTTKAQFDATEVWTPDKIAVPGANRAEHVNAGIGFDLAEVTLIAVGGPGKVSCPDALAGRRGTYNTSGTSHFSQGNRQRQVPYKLELKDEQTTVESEVPHVLLQARGLDGDRRLALRIKDEQGREVPLSGPHTADASVHVWFVDVPADAKTLSPEVIVHRCRTFKFLVAPPNIEPTSPSASSRSPRSPAQRLADARQAIDSGQQTVANHPTNAGALNNLAWAYVTAPEELRDAEEAVALAERAVQLEPGNSNSLNTLGAAYFRAGEYDTALATLERNASQRTDAPVLFDLYPLAMSQFQLGHKDKARETYQRAIDLHRRLDASLSVTHWQELYEFRVEAATLFLGEPPQAVFDRAGQLAREGKWEPAATEFAKGLEVYPVDHWPWYRCGALHAYLNRPDECRSLCRKMLELFGDTNDPFIAERAGKLSLLLPDAAPDAARAAQLCEKSASLRPDVSWFQLAAAIAEYRSRQFSEALASLEAAEAQVGDQVHCRVLIELFCAMSLHRAGKPEAARQSLAAAVGHLSEIRPKPAGSEAASLDYGESWHDLLMCEVILREAESLLRSKTPP